MNRGLADRDWAIMYMAWMNELPVSDTIWRYEAYEKKGDERIAELLEGGRQMAKAWEIEAAKETE